MNDSLIPCSYCLNALSDPSGELEPGYDFSSLSVGSASGCCLSIDSSASIGVIMCVTSFNDLSHINDYVAFYAPKYCPECGRRLVENANTKISSPPEYPEDLTN